jgi:hypothetical protein
MNFFALSYRLACTGEILVAVCIILTAALCFVVRKDAARFQRWYIALIALLAYLTLSMRELNRFPYVPPLMLTMATIGVVLAVSVPLALYASLKGFRRNVPDVHAGLNA